MKLKWLDVMKLRYLFLSLFLFVLLTQITFAYEIECDIAIKPHRFDEIVTTKSIRVNITLINEGDRTFPNSTVDVKILTPPPSRELLEDYYSYRFSINDLAPNNNFSYEKPYRVKNKTTYAVFETPIAGTWEVRLGIFPLPTDETTYTYSEDIVRRNGECRKYFSVKEFSEYQSEQIEKSLLNDMKALTEDTRNLNIQIKELTKVIIILTVISIIIFLRRNIYKFKEIIIGIEGIIIFLYYFRFELLSLTLLFVFIVLPIILIFKYRNLKNKTAYLLSLLILSMFIWIINLDLLNKAFIQFELSPINDVILLFAFLIPIVATVGAFYDVFYKRKK